ncbi:MAG: capsular biosynthesis protein [Terrimonas sp.]|nr:capsular biosynthesis protein [Terrimonas sp.]
MFGLFGNKNRQAADYAMLQTDMHSHLIPGIDDGAQDMETSLSLVRGMQKLGFKKIITTPHVMWDMYKNESATILSGLQQLQNRLDAEGIEMEITAGAEYFLDDHVKDMLKRKEPLLTISGNLVLVEFSMASPPLDLKELLFEMQLQGYQPVIAHPERYVYQERNKSFFQELKAAGYFFQLNLLSLAGFYGKAVQDLSSYLLKNDYYDLAGSDLHSERHLEMLSHPAIAAPLSRLLGQGRLLNPSL